MKQKFTLNENHSHTLLELHQMSDETYQCCRCGSEVKQTLPNPDGWYCESCKAIFFGPFFDE
ncbi:hypothetical protein UY456_23100 [Paenibacillus polymyxa]|uniref:hypothetical protein n=1 Tax=Paenibacillus polymyxa TaxID=1406 RepID=UPI002AB37ACB|nr:hypothetical protein [Paenibacillus polymyxa]MDY8095859.1 hypothetical protein [Paenibacillus polymyxa]